MTELRPCVLIPVYDNPLTLRRVVEEVRAHLPHILVLDDGSAQPTRAVADELAAAGLAEVLHLPHRGKGAAMMTGFAAAAERGFTHGLQIDADGQMDTADVPRFLAAAAAAPDALVLGDPVFDESAPRGRAAAHAFTNFWARLETGGASIADAQCGFRVYPIAPALAARPRAPRMAFDIEIAVRMVWAGAPVVNVPTRVRYLPPEEGGVSHFRPFGDNLRITWAHTRLTVISMGRRLRRLFAGSPRP